MILLKMQESSVKFTVFIGITVELTVIIPYINFHENPGSNSAPGFCQQIPVNDQAKYRNLL